MEFEWDEKKNKINFMKHGIDFETARFVFFDDQRLEIFDEENSTETEERFDVIGRVDQILFVVYTERREKIRLISARLATRAERNIYYDRDKYIK